jgi:hypothetical protein
MGIRNRLCVYGLILTLVSFASCALGEPAQNTFDVVSITDDVRGMVCVSEILWAGSVDNNGEYDKPDDCFIELYNGGVSFRSLKGWTLRFTDVHGKTMQTITLPGGYIASGGRYTIGRDTRGAFSYFDHCEPGLRIPRSRFAIEVQDSGGRLADAVDFTQRDYLPGSALPTSRRSAVRSINFFGEPEGNDYGSWFECGAVAGGHLNIKPWYRNSMYCAPGRHKPEAHAN